MANQRPHATKAVGGQRYLASAHCCQTRVNPTQTESFHFFKIGLKLCFCMKAAHSLSILSADFNTITEILCDTDKHLQGCSSGFQFATWFHIFLTKPRGLRPGMEEANYKLYADWEPGGWPLWVISSANLSGSMVRAQVRAQGPLLVKQSCFPVSSWQQHIPRALSRPVLSSQGSLVRQCRSRQDPGLTSMGCWTELGFPGVNQHLCTRQ